MREKFIVSDLPARRLATLSLALALTAGCATPPPPATAPAVQPVLAPAKEPPPATGFTEDLLALDEAPTSPSVLETDPLYRAMSAEFAGQRDELGFAVQQYAALAEGTRDPAIAERATRVAMFAEDDTAALKAAERWVSLAPTDLEARQIAAALHVRRGEAAPAIADRILAFWRQRDQSQDH